MTFVNPGRLYLQKHGKVESYEDILAYADFLRVETGLDGKLPVDLDQIYKRFNIPHPKFAPLPNQQGLLLDPKHGIILINSKDPERRQKFTAAHELVELLFSALPQGKDLGCGWFLNRPGGFKESTKEYLCNWTAANLLIPPTYVLELIQQYDINFESAHILSEECEVSLSAALVQLARISPRCHFVVLWRMKNKPTEIRNKPAAEQLALFDKGVDIGPAMKLRVEWSMGGPNGLYIPENKSTENSSLIYAAWQSGNFTSGKERMVFDNRTSGWYYSENLPFESDCERYVLSLIEHLGKEIIYGS
jgi:Zn-dependent peptidase ImmA (M78 family)